MTETISGYEEEFETTIKRDKSVKDMVKRGTPYDMDEEDIQAARSESFDQDVFLSEEEWERPQGAFGDDAGPS
ncbi:hypothetical protein [Salinibacter grassmerensis]|uniref:hypothetical protein n=1 Tax=Salinibacter grassmerensis TaxID=3040353 RepID=UPI0021E933C7|nr:hypothetical protein [Salinibacter grassmerensis]